MSQVVSFQNLFSEYLLYVVLQQNEDKTHRKVWDLREDVSQESRLKKSD